MRWCLEQIPRFSIVIALALSCGCASSRHSPEEKYFLIATNIKLPYWQAAQAGLVHAASTLGVKTELAGPDTYDPQAQHEAIQKVIKMKPAGILVSAGDAKLIQPDIDGAISAGIPVITMDSDAEGSKRLLFIGTDNYKAGTQGGELVARELKRRGQRGGLHNALAGQSLSAAPWVPGRFRRPSKNEDHASCGCQGRSPSGV